MTRVQIPVYADRWMRGDQYGVIVKVTRRRFPAGPPVRADDKGPCVEIAHVRLDKSGKIRKFILDDCKEID